MDAGLKTYVSSLNEFAQKKGWSVDYDLVNTDGQEHMKTFTMRVVMNGKSYHGVGQNKEEAGQNAAKNALHALTNDEPINTVSDENASREDNLNQSSSNTRPSTPAQLAWSESSDSGLISQEQYYINAVSHQPPTSRFLEDFDIKSITRIGRGGFGRVFKARRRLEDTTFAVKIVKFNEKARREVEALSSLNHFNIVRYHTSWTENTAYKEKTSGSSSASFSGSGSEFLYIQMEFCEGKTLEKWIEERNNHPEKYPDRRQKATEIIKQVLKAVAYVHLKNLFHRDLKPANIMFGPDGGVKVVDFGLVTNEERDGDGILLERTMGAGTSSYMSPEQIQEQDYNKKVDIYAVGLIYFELLWRFGTQNEKSKRWDDIRSKTFPEEFFKSFDFEHKLIERMLCEKPEERSEASNLLTELEQHSTTNPSSEHKVCKGKAAN